MQLPGHSPVVVSLIYLVNQGRNDGLVCLVREGDIEGSKSVFYVTRRSSSCSGVYIRRLEEASSARKRDRLH